MPAAAEAEIAAIRKREIQVVNQSSRLLRTRQPVPYARPNSRSADQGVSPIFSVRVQPKYFIFAAAWRLAHAVAVREQFGCRRGGVLNVLDMRHCRHRSDSQ